MENDATRNEDVATLWKMIQGIRVAMLVTVDIHGMLHSRPLATQEVEFDGFLWFFTNRNSPKIGEINNNANVNVAYADPDTNRYVSVSGRATIVDDRVKAKQLWTPAYLVWFPRGAEDPELTLLRVEVEHAQYWDSPSSTVITLLGFAARLTGKQYQGAESTKVKL